MCGFTGYIDLRGERSLDNGLIEKMTATLVHRGPDSAGYFTEAGVALGFRRLSIVDLAGGDQPLYNEDRSLVLLCNGEIYNHRELRAELEKRGHTFRTKSDAEVAVHLYEEHGPEFVKRLNGQFAIVIYDRRNRILFATRDHFGIQPLYHTLHDGMFIFASEIKALLQYPGLERAVEPTALDQIFSFPGPVSPFTAFKNIFSLKSGHRLSVRDGNLKIEEYWDLDYPVEGELDYDKPESYYVERLRELFEQSVSYRLQADVAVGFYLSGGLDSSLMAAVIKKLSPEKRHSYSIAFKVAELSESGFQRKMAAHVDSEHHEIMFDGPAIIERMHAMLVHSECPLKETYNTCSLALSQAVRENNGKVILTAEGADELFAGYVGYKFDSYGFRGDGTATENMLEDELRQKIWGSKDIFYEKNQYAYREIKNAIYSEGLNERYHEFDCFEHAPVNTDRLKNRHRIHQRSYLDFKLRLCDHLLADHGDRMAMAHSVEARYPFLDINLVEFARLIPPHLKLNGYTEKYILRKMGAGLLPSEILNREKFEFRAPASSYLLQQNIEWINDLLSYDRVKRQGYFNPDVVERLKKQYVQKGFKINFPFENDLLIIIITFNLFLDTFQLPDFN